MVAITAITILARARVSLLNPDPADRLIFWNAEWLLCSIAGSAHSRARYNRHFLAAPRLNRANPSYHFPLPSCLYSPCYDKYTLPGHF